LIACVREPKAVKQPRAVRPRATHSADLAERLADGSKRPCSALGMLEDGLVVASTAGRDEACWVWCRPRPF
jgi:hypothetical protein